VLANIIPNDYIRACAIFGSNFYQKCQNNKGLAEILAVISFISLFLLPLQPFSKKGPKSRPAATNNNPPAKP